MSTLLFVVLYIFFTFINYGLLFASIQNNSEFSDDFNKLTYKQDMGMSIIVAMMFGLTLPIGTFAAWCVTGFAEYGWKIK